MQIKLKIKRIYSELRSLQSSNAMQRDLIRNLCSGGKDFQFLNCFRFECNYLKLPPIEGLPKIWRAEQSLNRNIERLYHDGFLNEDERACCQDIALAIVTTLRKHRLFLFLHTLLHPSH